MKSAKRESELPTPAPSGNVMAGGSLPIQLYATAAPPAVYIEKWATFHVDADGKFDVAIFSGELAPGARVHKIRIPVPSNLVGPEITATVESAAPDTAQEKSDDDSRGLWSKWEKDNLKN
jgi:hypothetical protein